MKRNIIPAMLMAAIAGAALVSGCCQKGKVESAACSEAAVVEAIMSRRSIRRYTDAKVEREKLQKIAECGIAAPSGMNMQPWEVRIVDDYSYIEGATEIYKAKNPEMVARDSSFRNMFRNASALICIATPRDGSGQIDAGLMAENMILAAQSMGLGTCCLGGPVHFLTTEPDAAPYLERLGFSEQYGLTLILAVGYPDEAPEARPRDASKVRFVE